jgi:hypothetical protein
VLRDADRSLAHWLGQVLPPGVGLRFETPDPRWQDHPPEPVFVGAFLHSVRQDSRARQSGWSDLRDADGHVVGRQPAPAYYRLAYLITAWAGGAPGDGSPADQVAAEHELLGLVIDACTSTGVLPDDCLEGTLAGPAAKTLLECAPDSPAATGALWAGLRLVPRPYLEVVMVAPSPAPVVTDLAPPARELVLNAAQEPAASAPRDATTDQATAPATAPARPAEPTFATVRRWDKQTTNELPSAQPPPAAPPA